MCGLRIVAYQGDTAVIEVLEAIVILLLIIALASWGIVLLRRYK